MRCGGVELLVVGVGWPDRMRSVGWGWSGVGGCVVPEVVVAVLDWGRSRRESKYRVVGGVNWRFVMSENETGVNEIDGFETFEAEFTKIGSKVAGPVEL